MRKPRIDGSIALAAAITATLYLPSAAAWAQENVTQTIVITKENGGQELLVQVEASPELNRDVEVVGVPLHPEHWIGLKLQPLSDVLRAQLDLSEQAGVVVDTVFPDSPAAEAGIQKHDIILSSGDQPIREGVELVELVAKAKDGELPLTILRKGKPIELSVTPAERPGPADFTARSLEADDSAAGRVLRFLESRDGHPRQFRIVRPGVVLRHHQREAQRLPEGMHIRIERNGGQPARITVDRGDEHWEVTEEELDKLPDDVREHVSRSLGHPHAAHQFAFEAPVQRGLRWLQSQQAENGEPNDDVNGENVWRELEPGGPLPREFNLDQLMEKIEMIREQFEQLTDEQAERTEGLIEEKGEEIEESLNDRVTRLEEMLTDRADQLREMIQSLFSDRVEVEVEVVPDDDTAAEAEEEDSSEAAEEETEVDSDDTPADAV